MGELGAGSKVNKVTPVLENRPAKKIEHDVEPGRISGFELGEPEEKIPCTSTL